MLSGTSFGFPIKSIVPRKQTSLPQLSAPGAELPPPASARCLSWFSLTNPHWNWMWSQFHTTPGCCSAPGAGTAATAHPPPPATQCLGKQSLSPWGLKPLGAPAHQPHPVPAWPSCAQVAIPTALGLFRARHKLKENCPLGALYRNHLILFTTKSWLGREREKKTKKQNLTKLPIHVFI